MYTYVCYTYSETTSKKVSNPFFSSSLKLCTYTRVRACFFLFESSRYDYRWNCNFILMLERKAHKKDNMNKFQFCKPIELDDVVRFMLLPPTKITVTQYSHFFPRRDLNIKAIWAKTIISFSHFYSFLFSFFFLRVCVICTQVPYLAAFWVDSFYSMDAVDYWPWCRYHSLCHGF